MRKLPGPEKTDLVILPWPPVLALMMDVMSFLLQRSLLDYNAIFIEKFARYRFGQNGGLPHEPGALRVLSDFGGSTASVEE